MKKRIISLVLCFSVCFLPLFSGMTVLGSTAMQIQCESATAKAGEDVSVDLKVANSSGFMALNLAILYDKDNLELTDIENKLSGFVMSTDSAIVWDGSKDFTGDGTLATLTFHVKETAKDGDYEVKVRFFEASNYDGEDVAASAGSGEITVQSETPVDPPVVDPDFPETDDMIIFADTVSAKKGDSVSVDLKVKQNPGFMALNLAILYDKENLELTDIENKLSGFVMSTDSAIVWDGSKNCTEDGTLATLTFQVKETAKDGDYEIKVRFFEASDYDGEDVAAVTVSGKIAVKEITVTPGDSNGDGQIDADDLIVLKQALLSGDGYSVSFDANGDGMTDIRDLVRLKKYFADHTVPLGK